MPYELRCYMNAINKTLAGALAVILLRCSFVSASSSDFGFSSNNNSGGIAWTNAFLSGVCTIEAATALGAGSGTAWRPQQNYFTTNSTGQGTLPLSSTNHFFRLRAVDVSTNTPLGYTNLLQSYGLLHTIAGNGGGGLDYVNYWTPAFEGGYATNAALSRPHYAMADDAGNVLIVDKDSHSVLKVTQDGRIHTVAGTHCFGFNGDGPAPATTLMLAAPNGLWVRGDGTFYILDTLNYKVRRVDTNGIMTTLFTVSSALPIGRGLWVEDDETDAYFCSGKILNAWTSTNGVTTLNSTFNDLGNILVTPKENIVATDRGAGLVYKVDTHGRNIGKATVLYGDGHHNAVVEGESALTASLSGVRGIWKFPTDGYLLALHEGDHVLYVDPADRVHIFLPGQSGGTHAGDEDWFYSPGPKITQSRSVSMDKAGNIYIVENDLGFVRKIDFQRLPW